jgi:citrate lyase subunit alpha/citrate CoA-transferase
MVSSMLEVVSFLTKIAVDLRVFLKATQIHTYFWKTMKNSAFQIVGYGPVQEYSGIAQPLVAPHPERTAPEYRIASNLRDAIEAAQLRDGAVLSFHHHLRNGDTVMLQVLRACREKGLCDLHIAPSSLFPCHADLIPLLRDGTITRITTSYMNGPLADAVRAGALQYPAVLQTHGGRAHAIETGRLSIDAAFIGSPAADSEGNITGAIGPEACGPLGYAMVDAGHAAHVVAVTDHITGPLPRVCIPGNQVDQLVCVNSIGNAKQIVSGTTGRAPSAQGRAIADLTVQLIATSGVLQDGFNFQTGAGATSLAVAQALAPEMARRGISGGFAAGGITGPLVQMFRDGLFAGLWDVQAFDLEAVASYRDDPNHLAMSASLYASPSRSAAIASKLDVMILGAAEVDTDFNVNVTQASDGQIIGGSGGHADTAAGAKLPIVTTTLTAGGFPKIVKNLTCRTTPGATIGALVTEVGLAIHPSRPELTAQARKAGLPVVQIEDLQRRAAELCPPCRREKAEGRPIVVCEYRDGTVIDVIRQ